MRSKAWTVSGRPNRPDNRYPWDVLVERLARAGVPYKQVQMAWSKQTWITPGEIDTFPKHVVDTT